jgi:hypothetical protein
MADEIASDDRERSQLRGGPKLSKKARFGSVAALTRRLKLITLASLTGTMKDLAHLTGEIRL